jgi:hypothetical protein
MTCRKCEKAPAASFVTGLCVECDGATIREIGIVGERGERLEALKSKCRQFIKALQCEHLAAVEAERDALADQNLELRGALEKWQAHMAMGAQPAKFTFGEMRATLAVAENDTDAALSLPLPAAAAKVAEWREKAELLDTMQANEWDITKGWGEWRVQRPRGYGVIDVATGKTILAALRAARATKGEN